VGVIGASYLVELLIAPPDWSAAAFHAVVPRLGDGEAVLLAVGIVGATVMRHAIYLHSGLTQDRVLPRTIGSEGGCSNSRTARSCWRSVSPASSTGDGDNGCFRLPRRRADDVAAIGSAYRTSIPILGSGAAGVFLVSLIASGLSSSAVGTMTEQVIMQGFVRFRIPLWLRLVTMAPSFAIVAVGFDATRALGLSQVVPSLILPAPMIAPADPDAAPRCHGFLRERALHHGGSRHRPCAQSPVGPANCRRSLARPCLATCQILRRQQMSDKPIFQPNDAPAGGWGALHAVAKALREESAIVKGGRSLLSMNQPDGFDCPGCAWPDPKHTSSFEFCENGAKAVAWETTKRRVTREFFATWTVGELEGQSDHWLKTKAG